MSRAGGFPPVFLISFLIIQVSAVNGTTQINQKYLEIPHTDKVLEICGIGENTLSV